MRKVLFLLTVALVLSLVTGCDLPAQSNGPQITLPASEGPSFTWQGVSLHAGDPFDPSLLPEADSVYQVPSCAQQGTDNVYNYGSFELTAFNDGSGEVIYSIYISDPTVSTAEGVSLSDNIQKAIDTYGNDYAVNGTGYTFTFSDMQLIFITQDGAIISMEYRMNTN